MAVAPNGGAGFRGVGFLTCPSFFYLILSSFISRKNLAAPGFRQPANRPSLCFFFHVARNQYGQVRKPTLRFAVIIFMRICRLNTGRYGQV